MTDIRSGGALRFYVIFTIKSLYSSVATVQEMNMMARNYLRVWTIVS